DLRDLVRPGGRARPRRARAGGAAVLGSNSERRVRRQRARDRRVRAHRGGGGLPRSRLPPSGTLWTTGRDRRQRDRVRARSRRGHRPPVGTGHRSWARVSPEPLGEPFSVYRTPRVRERGRGARLGRVRRRWLAARLACGAQDRDDLEKVSPRIVEYGAACGDALALEDVRTERAVWQKRVREIRRIVIEADGLADPPPHFGPAHDRVAVGLGQRGIRRGVVERVAVAEEPTAFGPAWMFRSERELLL